MFSMNIVKNYDKLKMNWLAQSINSENHVFRIQDTGYNFGTICVATGVGKSGVAIEDAIYRILNHDNKSKLVINVSCPILRLSQQFANDMLETFKLINGIDTDKIKFFLNSSDDGRNYEYGLSVASMSVDNFKNFENLAGTVNIVISCHKSLQKYVNKLSKLNKKEYKSISYLDEAHLVKTSTYEQDEDGNIVDEREKVDLDMLCKNSVSVYPLSATPDEDVSKTVAKYEKGPRKLLKGGYAIHVLPRKSILDGDILPPLCMFWRTGDAEITTDRILEVLADAVNKNPDIYHKLLVTVPHQAGREKLAQLVSELEDRTFEGKPVKVFAICSNAEGFEKYEDFDHADIKKFSDDVENYEGHCVVVHIKILREGVDIKGLTDCIIFSRDHGKQEKYRMVIQTIGRVLRCLPGERGKDFVGNKNIWFIDSKRKKKYGGVYFISPSDDTSIESTSRRLVEMYYGLDALVFEAKHRADGKGSEKDEYEHTKTARPEKTILAVEDQEIMELMMSIKSSLEKRFNNWIKNFPNSVEIYKDIKAVIDKGVEQLPGNYNTHDWLVSSNISEFVYDKIPEMFKDLGINMDIYRQVFMVD